MIYAEITDLEAGWRPLDSEEVGRAEILIMRASAFLDEIVRKHNIDVNAKADALCFVCCDLVQRKMENPSALPVSSVTQTAGSFSETTSYSTARRKSWELYPEDLALLGVSGGGARGIKVAIHNRGGEQIDW